MSITKSDGKGYVLEYETPEEVVSVQAKSVIMTIPSYVASNILRPLSVSIN
jgi:oxygen-dependent protoporphyrinogen oxidase